MSNLFERTNMYDDYGNLNTTLTGNVFLDYAIYTESPIGGGTSLSAITSMYNLDPNYFYMLAYATAGTATATWDFQSKKTFNNIYVVIDSEPGASNDSGKLQGSNDNVNWTDLDTWSLGAGGNAVLSMVASNVTYRYIRVTLTKSAASGYSAIASIYGVIRK